VTIGASPSSEIAASPEPRRLKRRLEKREALLRGLVLVRDRCAVSVPHRRLKPRQRLHEASLRRPGLGVNATRALPDTPAILASDKPAFPAFGAENGGFTWHMRCTPGG
jgi:hypothetical protein